MTPHNNHHNPLPPAPRAPTLPAARLVAAAASLLALAALALATTAATKPQTPKNEYEALKRFPAAVLDTRGGVPDAEGFVGDNRGHWYEAGMQRSAMWQLISAAVKNDRAAADRAWTAVDATFARQLDDGGFLSNKTPFAKREPSLGSRRTTAFFFIQELAHAILVVRQSPLAPYFEKRIEALLPKLKRAAYFATDDRAQLLADHQKAVNRIFLAAKAAGLSAVILDDATLRARAEDLITVGLAQRDPATGAFLESGGLDSSYNAVSLAHIQSMLYHMPHKKLAEALEPAMRWELTRIDADGRVTTQDNSRTGIGKEVYMGRPKNTNYANVALALAFWGANNDRADILKLAVKVIEAGDKQHKESNAKKKK